jgi:hypothetical protein
MQKKFYLGLAVLLSVSLFFIGCAPEADEIVKWQDKVEDRYPDAVVDSDAALKAALDNEDVYLIVFKADSSVDLTTSTVISAGKTVLFYSEVVSKGLEIGGTVQIRAGGQLSADSSNVVSVTGQGSLDVQQDGSLSLDAAASVDNGAEESPVSVLGTAARISGGTLALTDSLADVGAVTTALGYVSSGTLAVTAGVKPSTFNHFVVPAGKSLLVTTGSEAETTATLIVPARVTLTTSEALDTVDFIEVETDGTLIASNATGKTDGAAITVDADGTATVGTITSLASSSVAAGGDLTITVTAFKANSTGIRVYPQATVNGLTFPGTTAIKALGTDAFTVTSLTVDSAWTLDKALTLDAEAVLTVNAPLTIKATDGSLVLTASQDSENQDAPNGAKIVGSGVIAAGATEIVAGTDGWEAVGSAGTVTIAAESAVASSITASADTAVFTANGPGATITQKLGANNALTLAADTVVALGGTAASAGGSITLVSGTNPGKLALTADSSSVTAGASSDSGEAITGTTDPTIGEKAVVLDGFVAADLQNGSTGNNFVLLGGTTAGSITAGETADADVVISSAVAAAGS